MNWKRFTIKTIVYLIFCTTITAINNIISQIGKNYMAAYQMSITIDSSFWIQMIPYIKFLSMVIAVLCFYIVYRKEIKYIWNSNINKEIKGESKNEEV